MEARGVRVCVVDVSSAHAGRLRDVQGLSSRSGPVVRRHGQHAQLTACVTRPDEGSDAARLKTSRRFGPRSIRDAGLLASSAFPSSISLLLAGRPVTSDATSSAVLPVSTSFWESPLGPLLYFLDKTHRRVWPTGMRTRFPVV